jgi:hypothetical protein
MADMVIVIMEVTVIVVAAKMTLGASIRRPW